MLPLIRIRLMYVINVPEQVASPRFLKTVQPFFTFNEMLL